MLSSFFLESGAAVAAADAIAAIVAVQSKITQHKQCGASAIYIKAENRLSCNSIQQNPKAIAEL